jgi:replicative DNA helicase
MEFKRIQQLPNDLNLEKAVLGAILLEKPAFQDAKNSNITEKDFYHDSHASIFLACQDLYTAGKDIDLISVNRQLQANKANIDISFLTEVMNGISSSSNLQTHCIELRELAMRRDTHNSAILLSQKALDLSKDIFEVKDDFQKILDGSKITKVQSTSATDAFESALLNSQEKREMLLKGGLTGARTFSTVLDTLTFGRKRKKFDVLGAYTSHGKTLVMIKDCYAAAKDGHRVAIASLEMTKEECVTRIVAEEAGISYFRIDNGGISDEELKHLRAVGKKIAPILDRIFIYECSSLNKKEFEEIVYLESKLGTHTVYLDYIQIMQFDITFGGRKLDSIVNFTKSMKEYAVKYDVNITALTQLNREITSAKELRTAFIADSSSIEKDADSILLFMIYDKFGIKETEFGESTKNGEFVLGKFALLKQRGGATSEWDAWLNLGLGIYTDLEENVQGAKATLQKILNQAKGISNDSNSETQKPSSFEDAPF